MSKSVLCFEEPEQLEVLPQVSKKLLAAAFYRAQMHAHQKAGYPEEDFEGEAVGASQFGSICEKTKVVGIGPTSSLLDLVHQGVTCTPFAVFDALRKEGGLAAMRFPPWLH
jgi:hypothetical protein